MPQQSLMMSYLSLRKSVGAIGMALPFTLSLGNIALGGQGIEDTMSAYYYTQMGDVFVGSLFAIAVFLLSYHGHDWQDRLTGLACGVGAIGVALFPVVPEPQNLQQRLTDLTHAGSAALFFLGLAVFCLVLFKRSEPSKPPSAAKIKRNQIYTICGWLIVLCVAMIGVQHFIIQSTALRDIHLIFWLEATGIFAFGVSWFVKGQGLLSDQ